MAGSSIVDAVRSRVRSVPGVEAVAVFENTSDRPDADGIPAHSIEALVMVAGPPGTKLKNAITQAILDAKPTGIFTYGVDLGTVIDEMGDPHSVAFTFPAPVSIWIAARVNTTTGFPHDGRQSFHSYLEY